MAANRKYEISQTPKRSLMFRFLSSVLEDKGPDLPDAHGQIENHSSNISEEVEPTENTVSEREKWSNKAEFVLSALAYAVGLGAVWRFPWLCWKHGGGAFLIPYFVMKIFCGLPVFFMEVILAQYSAKGPNTIFDMAPLFKGLGVGMIAISFFTNLYYNLVVTWSFYYMFASFQSELPWTGCQNWWNTNRCYDNDEAKACEFSSNGTSTGALYLFRTCYNASVVALNETIPEFNATLFEKKSILKNKEKVPAAEEYFNFRMYAVNYQTPEGYNNGTARLMEDVGPVKWDITLTNFLAWIVIYLCLFKGIQSSGKVVYFTALFPYVILIVLLVYGATLEGAKDGIEFYIYPNFTKLGTSDIWIDAAGQVFFSLSVGAGGLMTYASYNEFNNNILRDTMIVTFGNTGTSILAGFPIFAILGFMAKQLNKKVEDVVASGSALAFVAYPEVVTKMPVPPLWSIIFFFMLLLLGLDSQFAGVEVILTAVIESRDKLRKYKPLISGIIVFVMFIITLNMTCDAGIYWEELINYYSGWSLVLIALAEVLVFGWIYGAVECMKNLEEMLGWKLKRCGYWFFIVIWKVICPLLLLVIVVFNFITTSDMAYGDYVLPKWSQALGWLCAVCPIVLIPIYAVLVVIFDYMCFPKSDETIWGRLRRLIRPCKKWKPQNLLSSQDSSPANASSNSLDGNVNIAYVQSNPKLNSDTESPI